LQGIDPKRQTEDIPFPRLTVCPVDGGMVAVSAGGRCVVFSVWVL